MGLTLVTDAALEPLSVSEAKDHLRVTHGDDDIYIAALVTAARRRAETYTARAFITQTWRLTLDRFPLSSMSIRLPRPPLQSVGSIQYVDEDGATQTLSSSLYRVATGGHPGRVQPAYNEVWPTTRNVIEAVTVEYDAGYGADASDVPGEVAQACRLMIAHWYENREAVVIGAGAARVPQSALWLLDGLRVGSYAGAYGITG